MASTSNAQEVEENESPSRNKSQSPWPHLHTMFECINVSEKICKFVCLLCSPKRKEVSAYSNSPSNLRKHIEASKILLFNLF
jgi:hypothetical protein